MLKGEVFGRQLFENQIFALFINTFLNGNNGVCDYLNGMAVTYSGNNVTIDSGAVCIQGRFLEEDTSTTLDAGNSNLFCKLVIEIDLDKINTEDSFNQGYYKVVTDSTGYPELTQTNIVGTNSGIYQYELARFKTSISGITDFQDMRTSLSIPTIYDDIRQMVQDAIDSIEDRSAFILKTNMVYSTEEVDTGKVWIDGKHIYRKVVDLGLFGNVDRDVTIEGSYDAVTCFDGYLYNSSGRNKIPLNEYRNSNFWRSVHYEITDNVLEIHMSRDNSGAGHWGNFYVKVIVEYTKTTE